MISHDKEGYPYPTKGCGEVSVCSIWSYDAFYQNPVIDPTKECNCGVARRNEQVKAWAEEVQLDLDQALNLAMELLENVERG